MAIYVKGNAVANATRYDLLEKNSDGTYTTLVEDASEINFDVSALGLAEGDHTLVVVAQADGYTDSTYSNEVVYTATGENGGDIDGSSTYPTVTWTVGSIQASDGTNISSSSRQRTNSIAVSDIVANITSGGTAAQFLVCCYDSSGAYLGQINTGLNGLIKGTGQWITQGTLITQSLLASLGVDTIRMVVNSGSAGSTFIMNGQILATSESSTSTVVEVDYPFELGTITKETGSNSANNSRARTADYFTSDQLGTEFTVSECKFLVACYTSDGSYLGQWGTDNATVASEAVLSTAQWLDAGTTINTATLFSSTGYVLQSNAVTTTTGTVGKIRLCAYSSSANPHVYVDGIALTE